MITVSHAWVVNTVHVLNNHRLNHPAGTTLTSDWFPHPAG